MQQNTCEPDKCAFMKFFEFDDVEQCPNFVSSWWIDNINNVNYQVKDCSPKRTILMIQDLHNRLIGAEAAIEQVRNENAWVQVVAEVLGKNSGIDLEAFVKERQRKLTVENMRKNLQVVEGKKSENEG